MSRPYQSQEKDDRRSSVSYPYSIVDIANVVVDVSNQNRKGKLSIAFCPGKQDDTWNRNLEMDLTTMKQDGIHVIVCLLEWSEMKKLNIMDYPFKAQEQGFIFYHLPIRDRSVPKQSEINVLVPTLVKLLSDGKHILVHCRGGLGRAGTICACCLIHFGYDSKDAISTVRKQRQGAIQNSKQEECIATYYKMFNYT